MFLSTGTVRAFASQRNNELSLAYLKENGELLTIAASSGLLLEPAAFAYYRSFYDNALQTCKFFPQYFRFILAIVLNLEDLGYEGNTGTKICDYVARQGFLDYDTSDIRRFEILTLLARRREDGPIEREYRQYLTGSVDKFISRPDHFIKFNRPLFYDLTHFIFFLTKYGQTESPLKNSPLECLTNVGILALLDDDVDLLAEICVCFRFLGEKPPPFWLTYVEDALSKVIITYDNSVTSALNSATDDYHPYIIMNWLLALRQQPTFTERFKGRTPYFLMPEREAGVLSILSDALYKTQIAKTMSDKECTKTLMELSPDNKALLSGALASTPQTTILLSKYSQGIFGEKTLASLL